MTNLTKAKKCKWCNNYFNHSGYEISSYNENFGQVKKFIPKQYRADWILCPTCKGDYCSMKCASEAIEAGFEW